MARAAPPADGPRVRRRVEHADQVPSRWPSAGDIWNLLPHLARADRSGDQRGRRSGVLGCTRAGSDCMTATRAHPMTATTVILRKWTGRIRTAEEQQYVAYIAGTGLEDYAKTPGNLG